MSTINGNVLITYDLNTGHKAIKDAMIVIGYLSKVKINGVDYDLPNTTLWKQNTSTDRALADLRSVCNSQGIILEKAVAVLGSEWVAHNK